MGKWFYPSTFLKLMGYETSDRHIFRNYLSEKFLSIPLRKNENFTSMYLPEVPMTTERQKRFMTPKSENSHSVDEEDAIQIQKELEKENPEKTMNRDGFLGSIAEKNRANGNADRIEWKTLFTGQYKEYFTSEAREGFGCMTDIYSARENCDKFMILLLYSIFQNHYEAFIRSSVHTYLKAKDPEWKLEKIIVPELPKNCRLRYGRETEYYDKWDEKLFLEKEGGKTLDQVYISPKYDENETIQNDLNDYIKRMLERQENPYKRKGLSLILGGPGSGKSTLFSAFLHRNDVVEMTTEYGENAYVRGNRRIFLYCFRDMNKDITWKNEQGEDESANKILNKILAFMRIEEERDLANTILLLDGFDECSASENQRGEILKGMAEQWGIYARIFVTCRHTYIQNLNQSERRISCISLRSFDRKKTESFIYCYKGLDRKEPKDQKKAAEYLQLMLGDQDEHEVYGIPIVLYMVMAMEDKIQLHSDDSLGKVYEEIFRENDGIYDRMISGKGYDDKYVRYNLKDNFSAYKRYLADVSREIAFYMFEHGADNTADVQNVFHYIKEKMGLFVDKNQIEVDLHTVLSSGMFMYIDGEESQEGTIRFVHKSMYEYFMADYIFQVIWEYYQKLADKKSVFKDASKELQKKLAELFRRGRLTSDIGTYLEYKLAGKAEKKVGGFSDFEKAFVEMLNMGMLWQLIRAKERREDGKNILDEAREDALAKIRRYADKNQQMPEAEEISSAEIREQMDAWETQVFENMIHLIQIFRKAQGKYPTKENEGAFPYLFGKNNSSVLRSFPRYLRMKHYTGITGSRKDGKKTSSKFDLSGINLAGMDLSHADLNRYNFSYSNAEKTSFRKSNLQGANFTETVLEGAAFTGANLIMTTPKAEELFDAKERGIPWTEFTGYYPEQYKKGYTYEGQRVYKGATIKFGRYPQESNDKENRTPIEWRVLEVRGNRALLLSEKILDQKKYNEDYVETNWERSTLRKWLNGREERYGEREFLSEANFSQKERKKICKTLVEPHKNIDPEYYEIEQGNATEDQVFLLSGEEIAKYFALELKGNIWYSIGGEQAVGRTTEYAHSKGLNASGRVDLWWLRSVGVSGHDALYVNSDGDVYAGGFGVYDVKVGVRPALWISLKS